MGKDREGSWSGLFRVDKVNPVRDGISNGVKNFKQNII